MKILILIIIAIFIHSLMALYIDKYKRLENERVTNFSLIPFANVYLLGKHVFNRVFGIIILILLIVVTDFSITLFGTRYGFSILPEDISFICFIVYAIAFIVFLIYAIRKYNAITNEKDKFKFEDMFYYIKETLWIVIFVAAIYLLLLLLKYGTIY